MSNEKWGGEGSAQEPGFGVELQEQQQQHPSVQGAVTGGRQELGTVVWVPQLLCVMPAALIVLCLLPCSWIASSSYLKNTWAAHNSRLSHSSEAVVTTWLFKAMSCLPCLAELGYSLHLCIPNSWAASKRFFSRPSLLPGILLSDLNVELWLCLKLGSFWPASSGRCLG